MSDTAAERYPMMEWRQGWEEEGRGGSGSIGLVGWRFIYNAVRPGRECICVGRI